MNVTIKPSKGPCPYCDAIAKKKGKEKQLLILSGEINAVVCKDHIFTVIEQQAKKE